MSRSLLSKRAPYRPAFANVFADAAAARVANLARATVGEQSLSPSSPSSAALALLEVPSEVGAFSPNTEYIKDRALYIGAPLIVGGILGGVAGGVIWALLLAAAGGGAGYVLLQRKEAAEEVKDLCVEQFPEPARTQAKEAIAKKDRAKLESISTQADARGWHCGAKELRAALPEGAGVIDPKAWVPGCIPPSDWKPPAGARLGEKPPAGMFPGWTPGEDFVLGKAMAGNCPPGWSQAPDKSAAAAPPVPEIRATLETPECWGSTAWLPQTPSEAPPFHVGSSDTVNPPDLRQWARDALTIGTEPAIESVGQYMRLIWVKLEEDAGGETAQSKIYKRVQHCFLNLAEKMRTPGYKK